MKKINFLIFLLLLINNISSLSAQFTTTQKDKVLQLLKYPSAKYDLAISFQASPYYLDNTKDSLDNLSSTELLKKITNTPKDAPIYAKLALQKYKENSNDEQGKEYFIKTIDAYQTQINNEPENIIPIEKLIDFTNEVRNGEILKKAIDYALQIFPNKISILLYAANFHLNYDRDFQKVQNYIDICFQIEPYNLSAIVLQLSVNQMLTLQSMQSPQKVIFDISIADKFLKEKPNEIVAQHLYHYAQISNIYITTFSALLSDTSIKNMENPFDFIKLDKKQSKIIKEAENFLLKNSKNNTKYKGLMLQNLGFIAAFEKKYSKAIQLYNQYFEETKDISGLESCILLCYLQKDFKKAVLYAEKRLQQQKDLKTSAVLVRLYKEVNQNQNITKTIESIDKMNDNAEKIKTETLAVYHLFNKNTEKAMNYINELVDNQEGRITELQMIAFILADKTEEAKQTMQKMIEQNPKNEKIIKMKKILKF